ncbi:MAG: anaerobic ribonucleoside-triphosphate reductase activating protein [Bacillota bacterium]|nr:anaerobic ribonucleoside-triphosphate reductase activating protein [Bacillota bacterium]
MRYGQIRQYDVANGTGIRTSLFVTGCTHNCKGCFNQLYMDFNHGDEWTDRETRKLLDYLREPVIEGLTVLGGEPFQNVEGLLPVLKLVREQVDKSIWIYSGYTWEELVTDPERLEMLKLCDVLVDGRFVQELFHPSLAFRGSENQRIIEVAASMETGTLRLMFE